MGNLQRFRMRLPPSARLVFELGIIMVAAITFVSIYFKIYPAALPEYPDCPRCTGLRKLHGDSTKNDLVLAGVFGSEKKAFPMLRSLRSVGCKATVVFITNLTVKQKHVNDAEHCGAEYFKMKSPENTSTMYPHSLRYVGYQQFLEKSKKKYNRVLHVDSFDVFFQSDPFTKEISNKKLYFTMEEPLIKNSDWNTGWLKRAYNDSVAEQLKEFQVSCSGTLIGGYEQFKIYLNTLLGHRPFWMNGRHSLDQAYHNYLLHTGEFKNNGINPEYFGCNSPFLTMHYCSRHNKEVTTMHRVYCPDGKTRPAVVHQYNLFRASSNVLNRICPKA